MTLVRYIGCILLFSNFAFGAQEEIPPLRPPRPELHPSFWSRHGWLIVIAVLFVFAALGWVSLGAALTRLALKWLPARITIKATRSKPWRKQLP